MAEPAQNINGRVVRFADPDSRLTPEIVPQVSSLLISGSRRPFYAPAFLLEFKNLSERHSLIADWSSDRLVINLATEEKLDPEPTYTFYVLGENGKIFGFSSFEPNFAEGVARLKGSLKFDLIESIEVPIVYQIHLPNGKIKKDTVVLLHLPKGVKTLAGGLSLEAFDRHMSARPMRMDEALQHGVDMQYLRSRFEIPKWDEVANDYSPEAIRQAFARIHPNSEELREAVVSYTPLVESPLLAMLTGAAEVWIKDDSEQITGSFKPRGAYNRLKAYLEKAAQKERDAATLSPALSHQGRGKIPKTEAEIAAETAVVAASHGNHAQGVVWAASRLGFRETLLVLPLHEQTQKNKIRKCLSLGAIVMLHGKNLHQAMKKAEAIRREGMGPHLGDVVYLSGSATDDEIDRVIREGRTAVFYGKPGANTDVGMVKDKARGFSNKIVFVPTYNHSQVSTGQGTDLMEAIGMRPHLMDSLDLYAVGAGGLGKLAADATYLKWLAPRARVVGVNREGVPALARSLREGAYSIRGDEVDAPEVTTAADGVDVPEIGDIPFQQISSLGNVDAGLVTEDEINEALVFCFSQPWYAGRSKQIEGAPAAVIAAALNGALGLLKGKRILLSITGKNIDESTMARAFAKKGWVADNPAFYQFVTSLRREIRMAAHENFSLETFNKMLEEEEILAWMIAEYADPHKREELKEQIFRELAREKKKGGPGGGGLPRHSPIVLVGSSDPHRGGGICLTSGLHDDEGDGVIASSRVHRRPRVNRKPVAPFITGSRATTPLRSPLPLIR